MVGELDTTGLWIEAIERQRYTGDVEVLVPKLVFTTGDMETSGPDTKIRRMSPFSPCSVRGEGHRSLLGGQFASIAAVELKETL